METISQVLEQSVAPDVVGLALQAVVPVIASPPRAEATHFDVGEALTIGGTGGPIRLPIQREKIQ